MIKIAAFPQEKIIALLEQGLSLEEIKQRLR